MPPWSLGGSFGCRFYAVFKVEHDCQNCLGDLTDDWRKQNKWEPQNSDLLKLQPAPSGRGSRRSKTTWGSCCAVLSRMDLRAGHAEFENLSREKPGLPVVQRRHLGLVLILLHPCGTGPVPTAPAFGACLWAALVQCHADCHRRLLAPAPRWVSAAHSALPDTVSSSWLIPGGPCSLSDQ